jgi:exodeoxyribonuclease III
VFFTSACCPALNFDVRWSAPMKIVTWNVNGIRARQEQVLALIAKDSPDVVCLQEIKASPEQVPAALLNLEGYWTYWHGFKGYSGVALLVKKKFCSSSPVFEHPHFNMENRIVTAVVNNITVASVYVPNGGKDFKAKMKFLNSLSSFAESYADKRKSILICGDLNIAHAPIDVYPSQRREVIGQLPIERKSLDEILSHKLMDLGRSMAPDDDRLFTWWAPWRGMKEKNVGWRLDYFLVSQSLGKSASSCTVERSFGTSDHGPVTAIFDC